RSAAQARATELRQALVASARRGWRVHPPPARHLAAAVTAVKAAFDPTRPPFTAPAGPLRPAALAPLVVLAEPRDDAAASLAHRTLAAMSHGGVRDWLDGGFFQSARDPGWRVPDFVRPAGLNAALLGVYASAAAQFSDQTFGDVASGIADYLLRVLRD